jgi:hypothetical protein
VVGGTSQISTVQDSGAISAATAGVFATTATIPGACGYAWFWSTTSGAVNATLGKVTTTNSCLIATIAGAGTQAANNAAFGADHSRNTLTFDGLLSIANGAGMQDSASSSGAYLKTMDTATASANVNLTSDGAGGVVEIEEMLADRYDNYKLSFDTLWVHRQEAAAITKIVVANGAAPLVRLQAGDGRFDMVAGGMYVKEYYNKYTNTNIAVKIHPYLPAGTLIASTDTLPYPMNEVPRVWQMRMRQDYYNIKWPVTTRSRFYGTYADGFLQHYFPPALGVIQNIGA